MEALETRKPDLILMDVNLRRTDGRTMCKVIKRKYDSSASYRSFFRQCRFGNRVKKFTMQMVLSVSLSRWKKYQGVASFLPN